MICREIAFVGLKCDAMLWDWMYNGYLVLFEISRDEILPWLGSCSWYKCSDVILTVSEDICDWLGQWDIY